MDVTLMAVQSDGTKRAVRMRRPRLLIGRKENCDIRVPLASVSREHCELVQEEGRLVIRDLGSSNGTYVNRERVQERELAPGDLVAVGPAVFVIQVDGQPAKIDAGAAFRDGSPPQPVAAAAGPSGERPPSPGAAKPRPSKAAPEPATADLSADGDDDLDIDSLDADDSSIIDFDALLDDDEDEQPKL